MVMPRRRSASRSVAKRFWFVFYILTGVTAAFVPTPGSCEPNSVTLMSIKEDSATDHSNDMRFGKFVIPSNTIFYRSQLSASFVNLRPIVPGHVLVVPKRIAPLLSDLTNQEYQDIWLSVRMVQNMLKSHYNAPAFNVAVQDGFHAGQSVPHCHIHILPRKEGDFKRNDDVYDELEKWAPRDDMKGSIPELDVPGDEDRRDRTANEMAEEAALYRSLM